MRDDANDDETRPLDLSLMRARPAADPEPAVAEALAVVQRAIRDMGTSRTRPLLDAPPTPYRMRWIGGTDLQIHPIVLAAATAPDAQGHADAHRLLDAYAAAGGNAVLVDDDADGRDADAVGSWVASRSRRDATVLIGRIGAHAPALSSSGLQAATERLLTRLGTDRIDLLVLPAREAGTSMEETLTAALGLLAAGKVRYFAAADHSAERLIQARVTAGQRALPRFDAVLPTYSLLARDAYEATTAPVVHAQGLTCLPVSPLAGGFLAGAVPTRGALRRLRELDPGRAERLQPALTRRGMRIVEALIELAAAREEQPATVALAWLLTRPHVAAPVATARSVEHVWAATAAAGLHLTRAEVQTLDRACRD